MGGEIGSGRGKEAAARWGRGVVRWDLGIWRRDLPEDRVSGWVRRSGWIWIVRSVGFDGPDERSVGGCILVSHWWGSDSVLTRF